MEDEEVVEGAARVADLAGEFIGRLHREAWPEQAVVQRHVARRDRARRRVADRLAQPEILEKPP
jgi:hypothetical protein